MMRVSSAFAAVNPNVEAKLIAVAAKTSERTGYLRNSSYIGDIACIEAGTSRPTGQVLVLISQFLSADLRSAYGLPASRLRRFQRGIDDALNFPGFAEVRSLLLAAGDSREKLGDLDRLQIVEAQLVTGSDAEEAIGRMLRTRLDAGETGMARIARRAEMEQFIEPFLREDQRSFRAVDLEAELHLAAGCNPAGFYGPAAASGEAHSQSGDVDDFDRTTLARAGSDGTGLHDCFKICANVGDRPEEKAGHSNDVATEVGEYPATDRLD